MNGVHTEYWRGKLISAFYNFHFRGKYRLLSCFFPDSGLRAMTVYGSRMELDLGDLIQRHIFLGTYSPEETAFVRSTVREGMTVIDAGANVGYFTILAASLVGPRGAVLSFEPNPYCFRRLQHTLCTNGLAQVSASQVGLSDLYGHLPLYESPPSSGNHNSTMVAEPRWEPTTVPVTTLDRLLWSLQIDKVDLLKLDVEGHETRILRGTAQALARGKISAIIAEFNDYWLRASGSTCMELYDLIRASGFRENKKFKPFAEGCIENRFFLKTPSEIALEVEGG